MLIDSKWLEKWRKYAIDQSTDDPPGPINNYCLIGRDFRPVQGLTHTSARAGRATYLVVPKIEGARR